MLFKVLRKKAKGEIKETQSFDHQFWGAQMSLVMGVFTYAG